MLTLLSAFSLFVPFRVSLIYPPCMTHLAFRTPRWTTVNETTITAFGPINGPFKVVYCCVVIVYICLDTNSSTPQTLHITRFCHVFSPHPNLAPTYSYFLVLLCPIALPYLRQIQACLPKHFSQTLGQGLLAEAP